MDKKSIKHLVLGTAAGCTVAIPAAFADCAPSVRASIDAAVNAYLDTCVSTFNSCVNTAYDSDSTCTSNCLDLPEPNQTAACLESCDSSFGNAMGECETNYQSCESTAEDIRDDYYYQYGCC